MFFQPSILSWGISLPAFYITQLQAQGLDVSPLISLGKGLVLLPTIKAELTGLGCSQGSAKNVILCPALVPIRERVSTSLMRHKILKERVRLPHLEPEIHSHWVPGDHPTMNGYQETHVSVTSAVSMSVLPVNWGGVVNKYTS